MADPAQALQEALEAEKAKSSRLLQEKEALVAEFNNAETFEEELKVAKKAISDTLPTAILTIKDILANGESESTRAGLARYVMETVLAGKLDKSTESTVNDLINSLRAADIAAGTTSTQVTRS